MRRHALLVRVTALAREPDHIAGFQFFTLFDKNPGQMGINFSQVRPTAGARHHFYHIAVIALFLGGDNFPAERNVYLGADFGRDVDAFVISLSSRTLVRTISDRAILTGAVVVMPP